MKTLLVAFQGEPVCFAHVLLNALDMHNKNLDVQIIIEGKATKLIPVLANPAEPFAALYEQAKNLNLIAAVCKACAAKMGTLDDAEAQNLPIDGTMSGHPPLAEYLQQGYQVITF